MILFIWGGNKLLVFYQLKCTTRASESSFARSCIHILVDYVQEDDSDERNMCHIIVLR